MTWGPVGGELPLGGPVDWAPVSRPAGGPLRGSHVLVRPVRPDDAASLFAASHPPEGDPGLWTYLPYGPYRSADQLREMLTWVAGSEDPLFFALAPLPEACPRGMTAYLRITPEHGTIEIGHIWFGHGLRRTSAATEAIYLLASHAFDELGYRRLEWKCNALNAASRSAAERFGFSFEGIFRKHQVVKGRNRDTAWYSITDEEWPAIRRAFATWLSAENFDSEGRQRRALGELARQVRG